MDKYKSINTEENYKKLLSSGMFCEMHPELTGDWETDKILITNQELTIKIKTMKKYEVTAINDEEQDVTEFVQGDSILEAISEFYNEFGYQEILKIEVVGIVF